MTVPTRLDVPAATLEALMDATKAVLAADSLEDTFARIARHLRALVHHDDLVIYEVDPTGASLAAVFADGAWVQEVMAESFSIEEGITGHALRERRTENIPRTDLDPRCAIVSGTNNEPEALVCVPLVVEGGTIAALNVYRNGDDVAFSSEEAELIERFGAMAALAFNSARQRELLRAQARTDPLTGLLNRRSCHERLAEELDRSLRVDRPLSVVVIDLDCFKEVNDTHGHAEGDRVLVCAGERLRAAVRTDDTIARIGGDEFALIVPGAGLEQATEAADRIRATIAEITSGGRSLTASAGVAVCPADCSSAERLLDVADRALYEAKRSGRNRTSAA